MPLNAITETDFRARTFTEAEKAFARKAALTHDQFDRLAKEQKRKAFRIATVNNARLIQFVKDKLTRAIATGGSFRDWRAEVLALFEGEGIPAPALHRLKLAFRQNTLQSYSDARAETLNDPAMAEAFPYWMYKTVGNGVPGYKRVRREHAVLHGLVFRWNDPFWLRHRPPWGYGCRCAFIPLTASQVARRGLKVRGVGYVRKRLKVKPHPDFGVGLTKEFDLSGLTDALQKAVRERIGD